MSEAGKPNEGDIVLPSWVDDAITKSRDAEPEAEPPPAGGMGPAPEPSGEPAADPEPFSSPPPAYERAGEE